MGDGGEETTAEDLEVTPSSLEYCTERSDLRNAKSGCYIFPNNEDDSEEDRSGRRAQDDRLWDLNMSCLLYTSPSPRD